MRAGRVLARCPAAASGATGVAFIAASTAAPFATLAHPSFAVGRLVRGRVTGKALAHPATFIGASGSGPKGRVSVARSVARVAVITVETLGNIFTSTHKGKKCRPRRLARASK